jgi:EF-hand domain-containing protein 1
MSPTSRNDLAKHYYQWRDLRIGGSIQVYGRTMLIFDCDKFTRQWYQQHTKLSAAQLAPIKVCNPRPPLQPTLNVGAAH